VITRTELQRISQYQDADGHMLSLYLPVSQDRSEYDHNIEVKNLFRQAEARYERTNGSSLPETFETLFEDIRVLVRDDAGRYGRGLVLFATPERGILNTRAVPGTVRPAITIDRHPDIAQLVRLVEDYEPYCTCLISRNHARILSGRFDELNELAVFDDDEVPGQHDQGGWSQARYERHIEDHVHRHFKRVARELFELLDRDPYTYLILGGPEEVVAAFREALHPYVSDRIVGEVRLLTEANIKDIRQHSMSVFQDWISETKARQVHRLCHEARAQDLGVHGISDTVDALQRGQVMNIVIDDQVRSSGVICARCEALSVQSDPENRCRYCGGEVRDLEDIVPALVTSAFNQGADVTVIDDDQQREELARVGGIGALLRFRLEQQTA
jgi:peptide chain release factor subunit 1